MTSAMAKITFLSFLFLLFIPQLTFAEIKTFIKEYTYQAGDEDSKNSCRVISLREVKRLLLEELGTYLESETEVKNFQLTKDQITTLTAGIVHTEIIEEKWDGHVYWLKAKIASDSDKVVQSIDALRKDREKTRELESMKLKADELMKEVARLRKGMAAKEEGRDARKAAYDKSIRELSAADWIEKGHAAKDYDESVAAYSKAIELDPNSMKAYYFRARISERNQARSDYYKILTIQAKDSEDHLIRAWTHKELEDRDSALQEFGKAIETAKGSKEKALAYFDRGRYYYLLRPKPFLPLTEKQLPNALELSIQDFSSAIGLDPANTSYFHNRAISYAGLGMYDLVVRDYTSGIKLDPKNAGLYSGRGETYQLLQKHELAVADLSKAIELEGPDDLFASLDYMNRAFSYERLGKFDLAIQDWNTLHKRNPKKPSNIIHIADLYRKMGKYDQSIKYYNQAATFKLESYEDYLAVSIYYGRALAYTAKKEYKKAIEDLKHAIQLDPDYKAKARSEQGFGSMRNNPDFIKLVEGK